MNKTVIMTVAALAIGVSAIAGSVATAGPAEDISAFQTYFKKRFADTEFSDFKNGVYSIHPESREQWESIEDFPPYEIAIDNGSDMWEEPFAAYIAFEGRDAPVAVKLPESDKAMAWYEKGKTFFYAKRGQLNLACSDCHVNYSGRMARADTLGPALGHTTHFPVYRSKWGNMGTLHRRYAGCNTNVRAKPFKAQSDEYKALEYFQTLMSNGLEFNGPGARK